MLSADLKKHCTENHIPISNHSSGILKILNIQNKSHIRQTWCKLIVDFVNLLCCMSRMHSNVLLRISRILAYFMHTEYDEIIVLHMYKLLPQFYRACQIQQ